MPFDGNPQTFAIPKPVVENEAQRVLREAREALARCGWTQHTRADTHGRMCILGALASAVYGNPLATIGDIREPAWVRARVMLHKAVGGQNIAGWNDEDNRTKEEVLAAFDRAYEIAGEG